MKRKVVLTLLLTGLALVIVACSPPQDEAVNATLTAISQDLSEQLSATPPVTDAPEIVPTATAGPTSTATVDARATTAAEEEAAEATAVAATATAVTPILAELPNYGVDPANGEVAWIHPPVTIEATGYMTYTYANRRIATLVEDFVISADITWNTRFGTTGCGFVLRSDGNEEGYDQYIVLATRASSGAVLFTIMEDGDVKTNEITNINAGGLDPAFEWQNDTTNKMTIVARGNTFEIYTNGIKLDEVTPSLAFERGFVAFVALNESGTTTCHYDNAWLWLINNE